MDLNVVKVEKHLKYELKCVKWFNYVQAAYAGFLTAGALLTGLRLPRHFLNPQVIRIVLNQFNGLLIHLIDFQPYFVMNGIPMIPRVPMMVKVPVVSRIPMIQDNNKFIQLNNKNNHTNNRKEENLSESKVKPTLSTIDLMKSQSNFYPILYPQNPYKNYKKTAATTASEFDYDFHDIITAPPGFYEEQTASKPKSKRKYNFDGMNKIGKTTSQTAKQYFDYQDTRPIQINYYIYYTKECQSTTTTTESPYQPAITKSTATTSKTKRTTAKSKSYFNNEYKFSKAIIYPNKIELQQTPSPIEYYVPVTASKFPIYVPKYNSTDLTSSDNKISPQFITYDVPHVIPDDKSDVKRSEVKRSDVKRSDGINKHWLN